MVPQDWRDFDSQTFKIKILEHGLCHFSGSPRIFSSLRTVTCLLLVLLGDKKNKAKARCIAEISTNIFGF